ncbi:MULTISPECIES: hypothetical protein [unclassified Nocardiopsis]|uniref:hypothetical protein n=1 Tax=unclassified Nocardiopsis TaxID=2649073 RepID=UPI001F5C0A28|nr:hypothetical protein [Nocardiopsis sp. TSRI0078]
MRGARAALAGVLAALALAATACTAPALTAEAYRHDARQSAVDLLAVVRTGVLVAELAEDEKAFQPYLDVSVGNAEGAARSIADTFGVLQPPTPRCDGLRERMTGLTSAATSGLSDLRIAIRRGDRAGREKAAESLRETASGLTEVRKDLR